MDSKLINDPRSIDFERSPKAIKQVQSIYTQLRWTCLSNHRTQHKSNHLMPNKTTNHFNLHLIKSMYRSIVLILLINYVKCNQQDHYLDNLTTHFNNQTISFSKRSINDNWSLSNQPDEPDSDQLNESSNQLDQQNQQDPQDSTDSSKSDQVDGANSKFDQPQFDEPKQTKNVQKIPIGKQKKKKKSKRLFKFSK